MFSIESRTDMKQKMFFKMLFILLLGFSSTFAEPIQAGMHDTPVCDPMCGCDGMYVYDAVKDDCIINLPKLMKRVIVPYSSQNGDEIFYQTGMARSIYIEGEKLFRGIMISVLLFITCASLCILSACIYCCKINYSDRKLKMEVDALAKKMHKTNVLKRDSAKPEIDPKAQSCNVIVEEAGVFVV